MSETDSAVFYRTTPDEHGNFHQFRLVPSDGGDLVIRQACGPNWDRHSLKDSRASMGAWRVSSSHRRTASREKRASGPIGHKEVQRDLDEASCIEGTIPFHFRRLR
jgi:hypothetical protein